MVMGVTVVIVIMVLIVGLSARLRDRNWLEPGFANRLQGLGQRFQGCINGNGSRC